MEQLEDRMLLSVTPTEYAELRAQYSDFQLSENLSDVNIIELTDLTAASLQAAIDAASETVLNNLIVLRTKEDTAVMNLSGVTLTLDCDSSLFGSVTVVSLGTSDLRIAINDYPSASVRVQQGNLSLGGLVFTGFDAEDSLDERRTFTVCSWGSHLTVLHVALADESGVVFCSEFEFYEADLDVESITITGAAANGLSTNVTVTNYAVLFSGGVSAFNNYRYYYDEIVTMYNVLVNSYGLSKSNIFVLYADGLSNGVDQNIGYDIVDTYINSDMSFALSNRVFAATQNNLDNVFAALSGAMSSSDHLFFYTDDHGSGDEYLSSKFGEESLCGWGNNYISGSAFANSIFQICRGYVTLALTQCFSGGILDNVIDPLTGRCLSTKLVNASDATTKWYGMAAANHYETSWTRFSIEYSSTYGGKIFKKNSSIGFARGIINGLNSPTSTGTSVFSTAKSNDPFAANEKYLNNAGTSTYQTEHPWGAGATFSIFGSGQVDPDPLQPDLTPYRKSGWSASLFTTTSSTTSSSRSSFTESSSVFLRYAYINDSDVSITQQINNRFTVYGPDGNITFKSYITSLDAGSYAFGDKELGKLTAGDYCVVMEVDYLNEIDESDETNNTVQWYFTVVGTKPTAPSALKASNYNGAAKTLTLSWNDNSNNESGFYIWLGKKIIGYVGANKTSVQLTSVESSTRYTFKVSAFNDYGQSSTVSLNYKTPEYVTVPNAPTAVTFASYKTNTKTLGFKWTDNSNNERGFYVKYSADGGKTWSGEVQLRANVKTYSFRNAAPNTEYLFAVRSFNSAGVSQYAYGSYTTPQVKPAAATSLTISGYDAATRSLTLSWRDNSSNESGFQIWVNGSYLGSVGANITSVRISNLAYSTNYKFTITAYNSAGQTASSAKTYRVPAAPRSLNRSAWVHLNDTALCILFDRLGD